MDNSDDGEVKEILFRFFNQIIILNFLIEHTHLKIWVTSILGSF